MGMTSKGLPTRFNTSINNHTFTNLVRSDCFIGRSLLIKQRCLIKQVHIALAEYIQ